MKQSDFEKKYLGFWEDIEKLLDISPVASGSSTEKRKQRKNLLRSDLGETFPENYRLLCHHLSLARSRHYSPLLVERLEQMVIRSHQLFYKRKTHLLSTVLRYFTFDFARSVRSEWRWVLLSAILFFGSFIGMIVSLQFYPDMVYTVISAEQLADMETMYDPTVDKIGRNRDSATDFQMFGYYIFNNTGIGLKTFASGLVFGIGSVITLLFNGLVIGGVAGHLTYIGYSSTFWPFVSGHSAMELGAIVLSGAAGFKLGFSIISPGRKSRLRSLRDSAREAVFMMYGVATMFIVAAFIEAYWSSISTMPAMIKYSVGIGLWVLLLIYFVFVGRSRATR